MQETGLRTRPVETLTNKRANKEIRIYLELLDSDLQLASASKNSQMGRDSKNKINNTFTIAQWNIRGLRHPSKLQTINAIECDFLTLQEINHFDEQIINNIQTKNIIMRKEREVYKKDGGTMTLSNLKITHCQEISINKDCNLTRIVIDGVFVLWIGNIYLNRGIASQVNKLFSVIQESIPEHEIQNLILIGDFNINISRKSPKTELLTKLSKQFQLKINNPGKASRDFTTLDFQISGKRIEATIKENLPSCSDHKILIWDIAFQATTKPKNIYIPNKKLAEKNHKNSNPR